MCSLIPGHFIFDCRLEFITFFWIKSFVDIYVVFSVRTSSSSPLKCFGHLHSLVLRSPGLLQKIQFYLLGNWRVMIQTLGFEYWQTLNTPQHPFMDWKTLLKLPINTSL